MTELKLDKTYKLTKILEGEDTEVKIRYCRIHGQVIRVGESVRAVAINGEWWMTTAVQDIEKTADGCKFYTKNSEYLLEAYE